MVCGPSLSRLLHFRGIHWSERGVELNRTSSQIYCQPGTSASPAAAAGFAPSSVTTQLIHNTAENKRQLGALAYKPRENFIRRNMTEAEGKWKRLLWLSSAQRGKKKKFAKVSEKVPKGLETYHSPTPATGKCWTSSAQPSNIIYLNENIHPFSRL